MPLCGGIGELQLATAETQTICDQVKQSVTEKTGQNFQKFQAVSFKSQVVAGINYFIKVDVGGGCIHLRVYQPLPHTGLPLELAGVQLNKTLEDDIEYF